MSFLIHDLFTNLIVSTNLHIPDIQIAVSHLHHQRVVFLISSAFPFTLAHDLDLYVFFEPTMFLKFHFSLLANPYPVIISWTRGFPPQPSTCRVLDFISVSLCFGLQIWICMSLLNLRCFSNLLDGLEVAVKIAVALFLTCKSKTWGQNCGGCISKLLCICDVYHMWCMV